MTWNADEYDRTFSFVTRYGTAVLDRLDPRPGELIVDLGCGTGHLTAEIADRATSVEGLDSDPAMIARAEREHPDLRFRLADATNFTVPAPVDAVFSNATLHWIRERDQAGVLEAVHTALRPGGRFVAEMGGARNVAIVLDAVQEARARHGLGPTAAPWYFPSPAVQAGRLEHAGFRVREIEHFDRPTPLRESSDVLEWLDMFGAALLADVPVPLLSDVRNAIVDAAAPALRDAQGRWHIDYVRLRWYATAD